MVATYKGLSLAADAVDEEISIADESERELAAAGSGWFKSRKSRALLGAICILAAVAAVVKATYHYSADEQKSLPAKTVGDSVALWQFDSLGYCMARNGILHPNNQKCCAMECGEEYCGTPDCYVGPGGPTACCYKYPRSNFAPYCSDTQMAPCRIPDDAQLGPISTLFGSMSFTTEADAGVVQTGAVPAVATYFGLNATAVKADVMTSGHKPQGTVMSGPQLYSVEFQLAVHYTQKTSVQTKANAVYADHTAIQAHLDAALHAAVQMVSFSSPKAKTPPAAA